jgi:hypothetical protein
MVRSWTREDDGGWSWTDFGEATIAGAATGAAGGAVAGGIATDGAAPIGAVAGAISGAAGGAAAGALHYTVKKWWQFAFGFDMISGGEGGDFYTQTSAEGFGDFSFMSQVAYVVPVAADESPVLRPMLHQNSPNPFNPKTVIAYDVAAGERAAEVFDCQGRKIRTLVEEQLPSGRYRAIWTGDDQDGHSVSSGIYFCRLNANGQQQVKKMALLR